MTKVTGTILVIGAGILCASCSSKRERDRTPVTRVDSAGIEIVRNSDEQSRIGELVSPARRVWGSEAPGPELFGQLSGAWLHPNGSVWVAERQTQEIRVFDSGSGSHLFTIGGVGDGPAEFRRMRFLGFDRNGAAYVCDDSHRRLSVFSERGKLLRTEDLPSSWGIAPRPLHVTGDGTLLGQLPQTTDGSGTSNAVLRDTVRIWAMPLDAGPKLVAEFPGALWYLADGTQLVVPYTGQLPPPYGGGALYEFRGDHVYVTNPLGGASYAVIGPDGLERRVEVARQPGRTDFSATRFVDLMRRIHWPQSRVRAYEEYLSEMPVPEQGRTWEQMVVADDGGVWLLRRGASATAGEETESAVGVWDVFDAQGALVGAMQIPSNISPTQVAGQSVLTRVWDEVGRSSVAIYDLKW